jgi:glycosyltransferase involved in cell wall biosynthesis
MSGCDCIVPFYNEGLRPLRVVESIIKVKSLSKIIVVDDGSDSNATYLKLKSRFPGIISLRSDINKGKASAVKEGLKYAVSEYVFILDGDLTNIKAQEIEDAIEKIANRPEIGMIILRRVADETVAITHWFRHDIIFSGQRILRREDLGNVFENDIAGYQLESAINAYMIKNGKKVFWMPFSIHNFHKTKKWGWFKGLKKGLSSVPFYINETGLRQTLFFCRNEAPEG